MESFKLPDLGEGLPDAEIREWYVKVGDSVTTDMPLVAMETAKAVVDVPSPQDGKIVKLLGQVGDIIKTGADLVYFESDDVPKDAPTVVGHLETSSSILGDDFIVGAAQARRSHPKTTPNVRLLAKKLGIDLATITGTGEHGVITRADVEKNLQTGAPSKPGFEALHGVRRAMLQSMQASHQQVVAVSVFDEADIQHWPANADITVRMIRAITKASTLEPTLNAWFDTAQLARRCCPTLALGLAIDNQEGLFVPVIQDPNAMDDAQLRTHINQLKQAVAARSITPAQLSGATFTLSNFGKFSGRFATPIIVPPSVAILAVGRCYEGVISRQGHIMAHRLLPLSLSFDHRAVTGGEATRFLGQVIAALEA